MIQGWVFIADAIEHDGWLGLNGLKRSGNGYIAQEVESLLKQAEHLWNNGQ